MTGMKSRRIIKHINIKKYYEAVMLNDEYVSAHYVS
jgi:hypothetical protein